ANTCGDEPRVQCGGVVPDPAGVGCGFTIHHERRKFGIITVLRLRPLALRVDLDDAESAARHPPDDAPARRSRGGIGAHGSTVALSASSGWPGIILGMTIRTATGPVAMVVATAAALLLSACSQTQVPANADSHAPLELADSVSTVERV